MSTVCLQLYTYEKQKHHGMLTYEWLLACAKNLQISGGIATRAIAGYGRHGIIHEEHFFELASDVPIIVSFILEQNKLNTFLERIKEESLHLFYTIGPVEAGTL